MTKKKEAGEETFEEMKERYEKEIAEGKRQRDDSYFKDLGLPPPD